jgi:protein-tyrosine phosphatase
MVRATNKFLKIQGAFALALVDLHAHVLPGLDDGPADLDEALALLRAMAAESITMVVAGCHGLDGRYNATADGVLRQTELVNQALAAEGVGLTVLPGMELFLSFDLLAALRGGRVLGLNRSRYVLIELPAREMPHFTERAFFDLMIAGYRPILNHPERNRGIQRDPDRFYRLVDQGVGAMVTAASLLGRFGAEAQALAEEFLEEGAAAYVVSDAHDLAGRAPCLAEGLAAAKAWSKVDQEAEQSLLGL